MTDNKAMNLKGNKMVFIVIFVIVVAGLLVGTILFDDQETRSTCGFLVFLLFFFTVVVAVLNHETRYRDGQVDAALGKMNYELKVHDDSTRTWVKIQPE